MQVDVNGVQASDKVDKGLLDLATLNVLEQASLNGLAVWQLAADRDEQLNSLGIDVSNINSSFVSEENDVAFTNRVDADVELGLGRVRQERLDDEGVEGANSLLDLCT